MRIDSVVIDTTHGLVAFPHLRMQVKSASSGTSAKPQVVPIHGSITVPPMTTKTMTAFVDHSSEWSTTGTVTPVDKFMKAASLIVSHSLSAKLTKTKPSGTLTQRNYLFELIKAHKLPTSPYSLRSNPSSVNRWTRQFSL